MTWNRREFLSVSSLALAAGMLPRSLSASPFRGAPARRGTARLDVFTPLRGGVGIYENRGGVMGWMITPEGVVVVDTQFDDTAPAFADGLRSRTERRIDVLLNTHHHGDHVGGNAVLRPLADRIVAHSRATQLLQGSQNLPAEARPDTSFDTEWSISVGAETIRAKHYGRGAHTGGDATVHFEIANVVHLGDLLFNRAYPFIDGPSGASVVGWITVLEDIVEDHSEDTLFIFGHAAPGFPVTGSRTDLQVQRDFLSAALEVAEAGVAAGRSIDEVAESPAPSGFPDHEGPEARLATLYRVAYQDLSDR
jgi:cyclase